jgi:hypothetical protein
MDGNLFLSRGFTLSMAFHEPLEKQISGVVHEVHSVTALDYE